MELIHKAGGILFRFTGKLFHKFDFLAIYAKNPVVQNWTIAILLCLCLAFLLSPDLHLFRPSFTAGMIVPGNIKADRDFLVEDLESTAQKKKDAAENIKPIYDYDSNVPLNIKTKLVQAFSAANDLRKTSNDKSSGNLHPSPPDTQLPKKKIETALGVSLSSDEFNAIHLRKFSDELLNRFSRLISSVYESRLITNVNFTKNEQDKGIVVRDVINQETQEIKDLKAIVNISDINPILAKRVAAVFKIYDNDIQRTALSLTKKLIEPNLTLNKDATEKRKIAAVEEVKPVFFQVQKNEMIVREGEKIGLMELAKLDAFYKSAGYNKFYSIAVLLGIFLIAIFMAVILFYWRTRNWAKKSERSNVDLLVFSIIVVLQIIFIKIGIFLANAINRAFPVISVEACYFAIPFALGSMVVAVLINRNVALILGIFTSFLSAFLFNEKIIFPLFSFLGSVAAAYQIVNSRQRSAFIKVGLFLGLINMVTVVCLNLISGNFLNDLLAKLLMALAGGIVTGIIVAGITPVFESLFGFVTDIKLLELANLNQPIFQKMIIEAPGTYHHSIIVASLVEAASEAIGANSLLTKVSAYYHDIGKLTKSQYFIENQPRNENKHDKLSPKMSSLVIMSHVKDGCEMAEKNKLGKDIVNIIRQHHGTSIVSFFYDKA
ncbi:MAG TPA: HDIG domain-containing protein, partial [Smithellaceae bacterium]|nr:HDIG domain-containing protein [Smithellaceae bacterium]